MITRYKIKLTEEEFELIRTTIINNVSNIGCWRIKSDGSKKKKYLFIYNCVLERISSEKEFKNSDYTEISVEDYIKKIQANK